MIKAPLIKVAATLAETFKGYGEGNDLVEYPVLGVCNRRVYYIGFAGSWNCIAIARWYLMRSC